MGQFEMYIYQQNLIKNVCLLQCCKLENKEKFIAKQVYILLSVGWGLYRYICIMEV